MSGDDRHRDRLLDCGGARLLLALNAIEPFRTVSAMDADGVKSATASGEAAVGISVATGPAVTVTGTGMASSATQAQGARAQATNSANGSVQVVLTAPHDYVLQVTIANTPIPTNAPPPQFSVGFANQGLTGTGSISGVLQPGTHTMNINLTTTAELGNTVFAPSASASGSYSFTLTLTPVMGSVVQPE